MNRKGKELTPPISVEALRDEAYRLAEACQQRAVRSGATPAEKLDAEAAVDVITIAERKVNSIPTLWAKAKMRAFERWGEQHLQTLSAAILASARNGADVAPELIAQALEDLQKEQTAFLKSLNHREWEAWNEACERLTAHNVGQTVNTDLQGEV